MKAKISAMHWLPRLVFGVACAISFAATNAAQASTFKVLYSFCRQVQCGDGSFPTERLTMDAAGNLYGTAAGGAHGEGLVFRLTAPADGERWKYEVLYYFCARPNCTDGRDPTASALIVDVAGNVYGTTLGGGDGSDTGTVFELSPPANGRQWTLRTLYSFCARLSNCRDGQNPNGGLTYTGREQGQPYDGVSPLYGTASHGGRHFGGVAYSLTLTGTSRWLERPLYAFCDRTPRPCKDGAFPLQQLTMDAAGNLYGTTLIGGKNDRGVAFELSGDTKPRTETVLYDFCSSCTVHSGLTIDSGGNLFGSSWLSDFSENCPDFSGCGFIFKIAADHKASIVYNFCPLPNCTDGWGPDNFGGLLLDRTGNIYGTTTSGGANDGGVLFLLRGKSLQVLYDFCTNQDCISAWNSHGGLVMNAAGQLFGVTGQGGKYDNSGGTVFELTP